MKHLPLFLACVLGTAGLQVATAADLPVDRDAYEAFIERKQQSNVQRKQVIVARGLASTHARLVEAMATADITLPQGGDDSSPEQVQRLANVFLGDLALYAAALGAANDDVANDANVLASTARVLRSGGTIADHIALSDLIVVARAAGKDTAKNADGYLSGQRFVIGEVLKGDARLGQKVVIRQASGVQADGSQTELSSDLVAKNGRTYLLLLSTNYYQQLVMEKGLRPHRNDQDTLNALLFAGAYELNGERPVAVNPFSPEIESLDEIASLLRSDR